MTATLGHGLFLGEARQQREVPGFLLSTMSPTVPAEQVRTHTHETAHFVMVLAGSYISTARQAGGIVESPCLIYNPPGTTHRDRFHSSRGRFLTIAIARERLERASEAVELVPRATVLRGQRARTMAQRIAGELAHWDPASVLVAEGLSLELLAEAAIKGERAERMPPGWLRRACELLREQCAEGASISNIAAAVDVHPVHLTRTFRKFFRRTPGDYLRACRMEKAAALLCQTRRPLAEIALESGFADQSHFTKAFARNFGVPPSLYRRNCQ